MTEQAPRTEPDPRYLTRYFYFVALSWEAGVIASDAEVTQSFGVVDATSPEDAMKQAEVLIVNGFEEEWLKVDEDDLDEDEVDEGPATYAEACELLEENGGVTLGHIEVVALRRLLWGAPGDRRRDSYL